MADLNQVRRRADEFARLADGTVPSPSPVQDPEFARAMDLVAAMREAGSVEPRPEFSAALRQRLMDEARARIPATPHFPSEPDLPGDPDDDYDDDDSEDPDSHDPDSHDPDSDGEDDELVEPTPLHAARLRRGRLIAGAAVFVVLAGGVGSAAAAQQSMPGDTLYGLKRGLEGVASKASVTDDSRGSRDLSHALARLTEAEHLIATKGSTGEVSDTLGDFSTDTRDGGKHLLESFQSDNDATVIEKIYVFAADAGPRLKALAEQTAIRPAVVDAAAAVNVIVRQANETCPTCLVPSAMPKPSSPTIGSTGSVDPNEPATTNTRPSTAVTDPPAISGQPPTKQQSTGPTSGRPSSSTTSNPTNGSSLPPKPSVPLPPLPPLPSSLPGTSSRSPDQPSISLPITLPPVPPLPPLPTISLPLFDLLLHPTAKPAPGQNGR